MPRCFSISIQSDVAWRALLRALTVPAIWIAPPNSSSFSVNVVLPASGCEMMANVRRFATSRMRSAGKDGAFIEFDSGLRWKRKQKAAGQTAAGGEIARLYQGARAGHSQCRTARTRRAHPVSG